jgi:hypothetical protein
VREGERDCMSRNKFYISTQPNNIWNSIRGKCFYFYPNRKIELNHILEIYFLLNQIARICFMERFSIPGIQTGPRNYVIQILSTYIMDYNYTH